MTAPAGILPLPLHALPQHGCAIVHDVLDHETVEVLLQSLDRTASGEARREKNSRVYAMRNLLDLVPELRLIAKQDRIRELVEPLLGSSACLVRAILFDKTAEANWKVAWHQDLSIAVKERREVSGYGPWSMKASVQHVQPPREVLENMLTVRLHLDDCDAENGPLKVLPGSHASGVLSAEAVRSWSTRAAPLVCEIPSGGALLMRPLLLHASSSASSPRHRRVVHLEFARCGLSGGLEWLES